MATMADYCKEAIVNEDGDELVVENCKCPSCGERRMDYLVIYIDNEVRCQTCGTTYEV